MANEAVIIELCGQPTGVPQRFHVEDAVAVEKGTLMLISGASAVTRAAKKSAVALSGEPFAGIASTEKVASDGSTTLGLWTKGIFDLTNNASPAITAGALVCVSGANMIRAAVAADLLTGAVVGRALEDMAGSEVGAVAVGVYC